MNPYKWLYTYLTPWWKRPWTYVMRDFYHEVEYVIILGFFILGYFCARWISDTIFYTIIGGVTAGYILGHLFWGRKWISHQGEKDG